MKTLKDNNDKGFWLMLLNRKPMKNVFDKLFFFFPFLPVSSHLGDFKNKVIIFVFPEHYNLGDS